MKHSITLLSALSLTAALAGTPLSTTRAASQAVTITVTRSDDPTPGSVTATCGFTSGVFTAATDGCSFRRAVLEAAGRPQTDRPITIEFNLAANDPNKDLTAAGTWTIVLGGTLPPLRTPSIANKNGQVTIDGASQPNGRTNAPPIVLEMGDNAWSIESTNNVFRNLSFKKIGGLDFKTGANDNLVERVWMGLTDDGTAMDLRTPANPVRLAIGGGVIFRGNTSGNTVRESKFMGSYTPAINTELNTTNHRAISNTIGLRADGTMPAVPAALRCLKSLDFDPSNWYGGWGISIAGTGHTVSGNAIAGLHRLMTANETPAVAIDVLGVNHSVTNNSIGLDTNGAEVGTCSTGIKVAGNNTAITQNTLAGVTTGFEAAGSETLDYAIMANDSSPTFGRITVRGNIVRNSPGRVYGFGPAIPNFLKTYAPARVTSINGTQISGTAGLGSPCGGCTIDLYGDDNDNNGELLELLGTTTADANGVWSITLPAPLAPNTFLRTMSTAPTGGIIGSYGAGTTTRTSTPYFALNTPVISGALNSAAGITQTFVISTYGIAVQTPITYTFESTGFTSSTQLLNSTVVQIPYRWTSAGVKQVKVTATNDVGSVSTTFTVTVTGGTVHLPFVRK
jgi:hypothetical protein